MFDTSKHPYAASSIRCFIRFKKSLRRDVKEKSLDHDDFGPI